MRVGTFHFPDKRIPVRDYRATSKTSAVHIGSEPSCARDRCRCRRCIVHKRNSGYMSAPLRARATELSSLSDRAARTFREPHRPRDTIHLGYSVSHGVPVASLLRETHFMYLVRGIIGADNKPGEFQALRRDDTRDMTVRGRAKYRVTTLK